LSLSSYSSADPSSLGSVVRGSSAGRSGHCCDYLLEVIGPSGLAPIRPYVDPLHWLSLPGPQGDDLTNYGALGPFVGSFILLVDPGDIFPPQVACHVRMTQGNGRRFASPGKRIKRCATLSPPFPFLHR
jgi:hypothetical protein